MKAETSATKRVLQIALTYAWMIGTVFLGAGRIDWLRGWICVALWTVSLTVVGLLTYRCNPQLMKERASGGARTPRSSTKLSSPCTCPLYCFNRRSLAWMRSAFTGPISHFIGFTLALRYSCSPWP